MLLRTPLHCVHTFFSLGRNLQGARGSAAVMAHVNVALRCVNTATHQHTLTTRIHFRGAKRGHDDEGEDVRMRRKWAKIIAQVRSDLSDRRVLVPVLVSVRNSNSNRNSLLWLLPALAPLPASASFRPPRVLHRLVSSKLTAK